MAQEAYQGHRADSTAKARSVAGADSVVAPADRNNYDPSAFAGQPGAAARASGYPRDDAGSNPGVK